MPGTDAESRWRNLASGLSRFAGRTLSIEEEVYESASETNVRNRELVRLLEARDQMYSDPAEALDL